MKQNNRIVFWNRRSQTSLWVLIGVIAGAWVAKQLNIPLFYGSIVFGIVGGMIGFFLSKEKT